jgi:hypothetical protein
MNNELIQTRKLIYSNMRAFLLDLANFQTVDFVKVFKIQCNASISLKTLIY